MKEHWKKIMLWGEFVLMFFGIPLFMFLDKGFTHPSAVLLPFLAAVFIILRYGTDFRWKELVYLRISRGNLIRDGLIILACGAFLITGVLILVPGKFLNLPRSNIWIWLALCTFYPVFSAYAQEVLYRTFIFNRYREIFPAGWQMIAASGTSFSFVHILYYHPLSMILTLFAGIYLAGVYNRTRSVLYTAILHGILGIFVFTVGLGEFFWLDMFEYF